VGATSGPAQDLAASARVFHESDHSAERDRLASLIHEDAEMSLVMTHFRPVQGRAAIMDALYEERESVLYDATVESLEWLDPDTLLVRGQVRYAAEERGVAHTRIWWIDEFRDGLLWRVRAFRDEASARRAYVGLRPAEPGDGRG
jgi:hypothetical protein